MKKTLSVNISQIAFTIDEDAYEALNNYIDQIKLNLGSEADSTEVLADIEYRITEILSSLGAGNLRVVTIQMVDCVKRQVGEPTVFGSSQGDSAKKHNSATFKLPIALRKKLMRDTSDTVFAGVCSGLAAYFGLDIALMRVIFVLLTIFGGSGLLLYIVLWIVIPMPKTIEDFNTLNEMKQTIRF